MATTTPTILRTPYSAGGAVPVGSFCKLSTGKAVVCTADSDDCIGVAVISAAADGDKILIASSGSVLALVDETVVQGDLLALKDDAAVKFSTAIGTAADEDTLTIVGQVLDGRTGAGLTMVSLAISKQTVSKT